MHAFTPFDVSVVVPTYNRARLLARTLESLMAQRAGATRFEILVVDNNSIDDTPAVVRAFTGRSPEVTYLIERRQGVSHARNAGIAAARAPIVAFTDDDVEVAPTWVATVKHVLDANPDVDCIGGRVAPRWSVPPPRWLTSQHWGAVALQGPKGPTPYVDADHAAPCLITANFACRRAALEQVGGFSGAFLRDEDRELQLRLWDAGKRGLYVEEMHTSTVVPPDRLTRSFHRRFNIRVGVQHARMRYRERVDRDGRLVRQPSPAATLFGTPGFIYRGLLGHAVAWAWCAARLQWTRAFFHETRALYFAGYIWSRWREDRRSLAAAPSEALRFTRAILRNRRRALS
jgi:glycosyltransferase involved in cell wall biosynthesis